MNAIKVVDLHKKFKVFYDKGQSLKERILFKNRSSYEERWVLKGINLEIKKGEVVGLIGHNGCGKSTLLKLMTKIIYPDQGAIQISGRVSSLIELGAGFHPDMTGRENIYTNAAIFGLTKKEIDNRLDNIIEFSELEDFIDNPVRTYSSGMYMRLAFSVAINVDAEVLLIDEILAVGDANFQAKCFDRLRELKASGVTIVIVTHDTGTIENFCNRAVWINEGEVVSMGTATKVVDEYLKYMNGKKIESLIKREQKENIKEEEKIDVTENNNDKEEEINYNANRFGLKHIEIEKVNIKNAEGKKTLILRAGESMEIEYFYKVNRPLEEYNFGMGIFTLEGNCIMGTNTQIDRLKIPHTNVNGKLSFKIEKLPLLSGKYILQVAVVDINGTPMDFYREYCRFDVVSEERAVGLIFINHKWIID